MSVPHVSITLARRRTDASIVTISPGLSCSGIASIEWLTVTEVNVPVREQLQIEMSLFIAPFLQSKYETSQTISAIDLFVPFYEAAVHRCQQPTTYHISKAAESYICVCDAS